MYWKLRIPMLLFIFGFVAGLYQKFPDFFLAGINDFIGSATYIGLVAVLFLMLEKIKVNEKKVHFLIGIVIISFGFLFDTFMV
ncbi:hypothetical protein BpJC7_22430 [Weizmannia acidilactici]|uniref:Uncharacterized protein n=1 Tax=Weizmannia acidilactici TaxID=2607726 RepID=A0A5J4JK03_9BACI|nr:hypothetical protein [Weizmannia acidilactici]GER68097.1 hypothetical protein BpJC4_25680 [Weizmannia acidilactici]GER70940.1 hypothetical protein BpJC7_22430 [Weizmannia acidilactici]GER73945.1 hypothetical protein BpPP18_20120 [Weizmannia acidilactici]